MKSNKRRVAAIQMQGRRGDIEYNLNHVRELAMEAIDQGAEVVALPEFFTTTIVLHEDVMGCSLPAEKNAAIDLLVELATTHKILIGGSYLEMRDGDVYNCYVLARPDGTLTRHDKDYPTMIENAFYIGGNTDGYHETDLGRVGTAMCWETIRTQTVTRLKGRVDFLMTGSHWWSGATNWYLGPAGDAADRYNRGLMQRTPGRLARMLGVPNIHSAHCGEVVGYYPVLPGGIGKVPFKSPLLGETQITDSKGNILKRMAGEEGAGVIVADLDLAEKSKPAKLPNGFWIPKVILAMKFLWHHQRWASKAIYLQSKRLGRL